MDVTDHVAHRSFADAIFGRSAFDRLPPRRSDPEATNLDRASACLDKLPPSCRESLEIRPLLRTGHVSYVSY